MSSASVPDDPLEPHDPRALLVLVLDTSAAMSDRAIAELQAGLHALRADLAQEAMALRRVEIAILACGRGRVDLVQAPITAGAWRPPTLEPGGGAAPFGRALAEARALVETRLAAYRAHGVPCYRPWVVAVAPGLPGAAAEDLPGGAEAGAASLREAEAHALLSFFYIVVNGPEDGSPALTTRVPVRVSDGALQQAFQWLAASQKRRLPDPLM